MQEAVEGLSDQDIADVAAYFASLKSFSARPAAAGEEPKAEADQDPFAAVKQLTAMCAGCHGEDGNSQVASTPSLAGQHDTYLMESLQEYRGSKTG